MKFMKLLSAPPLLALVLSSCVVATDGTSSTSTTPSAAAQEARNLEVPDLRTKPNGDIEVVFPKKGCVVIFDRYGNLRMGGRGCDDVDLHRAKEAVRAHLAEQNADFRDV